MQPSLPLHPLRVLVVDDNVMLCTTLKRWLSREPGIGTVVCQSDWRRAVVEIGSTCPDIVLLDIDLPGASGLDLISPILVACPDAKVLMFSGLVTRSQIEKALDDGASGFLAKDQELSGLSPMLRRAAAGEIVLCNVSRAVLRGV